MNHLLLNSCFNPSIAPSIGPGRFYASSQLPFGYRIHQFIKTYIPRKLARIVATIWYLLSLGVFCSMSAIVNTLFLICWFPFRFVLPNNSYIFILEYVSALIFCFFGTLLLLSNSFTWPIFVYHGPFPVVSDSQSQLQSFRPQQQGIKSRCSTNAFFDSDDSSTADSSTTISPSLSPSPSKASTLHRRRLTLLDRTKQFGTLPPVAAVESATNFTPGKTVIMANHLSNIDGFLLSGLLTTWPVKLTYKSDLNSIPCLGQSLVCGRHIPIQFNSRKGGWGVDKSVVTSFMERVSELINLSISVLVFPEGARRRFNRMSPFRTGLFRFCVESQTEAYPIVLYGSQHGWPLGSFWVDFHEVFVVYAKHPVKPDGHSVDSLVEAVRNEMIEMLCLCPGYDRESEKPIKTIEEFERLERELKERLTFF